MAKVKGSIWIEGTYLHFVNASGVEYRYPGTYVGNPGGIPGSIWLEGSYVHFIISTGQEYYLASRSSQSAPGAVRGAIYIEGNRINVGYTGTLELTHHSDTGYSDGHSDVAHSNSHTNTHTNVAHTNSHSDTHTNVAHSNSHSDTHNDTHTNSHSNTHSDSHTNSHSDVPHGDQTTGATTINYFNMDCKVSSTWSLSGNCDGDNTNSSTMLSGYGTKMGSYNEPWLSPTCTTVNSSGNFSRNGTITQETTDGGYGDCDLYDATGCGGSIVDTASDSGPCVA